MKLRKSNLQNTTMDIELSKPTRHSMDEFQGISSWVLISNLNPEKSDEIAIRQHIKGQGIRWKPTRVHVQRHSIRLDFPGRALIDCAYPENANALQSKLHLTTLHDHKLWVTVMEQPDLHQWTCYDGESCVLKLQYVPLSMDLDVIRTQCKHFEIEIADIQSVRDNEGYRTGEVRIKTDDPSHASTLYKSLPDALRKVDAQCHIVAQFERLYGDSSLIMIQPIPAGVTQCDVVGFLENVVRKRPPRIWVQMPTADGSHGKYGYAVVEWSSPHEVGPVVQRLSRCEVPAKWKKLGSTLVVDEVSRSQFQFIRPASAFSEKCAVNICNIPRNIFEQDILDLIRQHGHVQNPPKSVHLRHHQHRVDVPGYVLIECANTSDAASIVEHLNRTKQWDRELWCQQEESVEKMDRNEDLRGKTSAVWIHGLHYTVNRSEEVIRLAGEYGKVMKCEVAVDEMGYPHGKAKVFMSNKQEAEHLFELLEGSKFKSLSLHTAFAAPFKRKSGKKWERIKDRKKINMAALSNSKAKWKIRRKARKVWKTTRRPWTEHERIRNAMRGVKSIEKKRHRRGPKTAKGM